jgi:hypothetical protein
VLTRPLPLPTPSQPLARRRSLAGRAHAGASAPPLPRSGAPPLAPTHTTPHLAQPFPLTHTPRVHACLRHAPAPRAPLRSRDHGRPRQQRA